MQQSISGEMSHVRRSISLNKLKNQLADKDEAEHLSMKVIMKNITIFGNTVHCIFQKMLKQSKDKLPI